MSQPLPLGAPGIYPVPPLSRRTLAGERMDVCAFVGVAPRGPARVPVMQDEDDLSCLGPERPRRHSVAVPIESWSEYRNLFGGFEGPGLLPYAVAAFFENGGRRAYVVRVVPEAKDPLDAVARGALRPKGREPDKGTVRASGSLAGLEIVASNEGAWGNRLSARIQFERRPLKLHPSREGQAPALRVPEGTLPVGSLLRLTFGPQVLLVFVDALTRDLDPVTHRYFHEVRLEPAPIPAGAWPDRLEVVTATLTVQDERPSFLASAEDVLRVPRRQEAPAPLSPGEVHAALGLSPEHPRYLGRVLCRESRLLLPHSGWVTERLRPDADLRPLWTPPFRGGRDRYAEIAHDHFFDPRWVLGDEEPGRGVHAVVNLAELSSLVVPDLYCAQPLAPRSEPSPLDPPSLFVEDVPPPASPLSPLYEELDRLRLNPELPNEREAIVDLQLHLVELAEVLGSFVVLLDVPPRLTQRQVLEWRARFDSSYAAAYHPWLLVGRGDDQRDGLVTVPPSAVAAGLISRVEWRAGLGAGPANVHAAAVTNVSVPIPQGWHDELFRQQVNAFIRDPQGVLLGAARTLSLDPSYRQLSVRRIMLMLRRALSRQMQWAVFETNNLELRTDLAFMLDSYLRSLHAMQLLQGASPEEAYFVRCDDELNPDAVAERGMLLVEVGVAPVSPLEFLLLRLSRTADGHLLAEERA